MEEISSKCSKFFKCETCSLFPNEKLCFYCKKLGHFVKICLKKKNDEKEKVNQGYEDHKQMFVATLSANDHTTYDWIVDSGATQHMTTF